MKYKLLFILALTVILASQCTDEPDAVEVFDYADQARKDNDSLVKYMQTHYLDVNGELQKITNSQTPIYNQVITQEIPITRDYYNDGVDGSITVNYKLYYFIRQNGIYETPTKVDSVHVSYKGMLLDHTIFDRSDYGTWLMMNSVIAGWTYGLEHFKTGDFSVNADSTLQFYNNGKGLLFIPSGLAYGTTAYNTIPSNSPLIFYVNLNLINRTDLDLDSILSMYEDINNNGIYSDDDTDGDGKVNYYDNDDDGDGTLTKNENADPNGDGNPADALDTNGNGTPDYLDPATK